MRRLIVFAGLLVSSLCAFAGPKVSVLGDSYSTFTGYVKPEKNKIYYHQDKKTCGLESVDQTWWMQVIKGLGGELEMNNSFSGSTICTTGYNKMDYSKTCFVRRANELGSPDVILVCGGTNDAWAKSPLGEFKYADWTDEDLKAFRPACAKMFATLKEKHPKAKIVFVLNSEIGSGVPKSAVEICEHYKIPVARIPKTCEKTSGHPTVAGMKAIADAVLATMKK